MSRRNSNTDREGSKTTNGSNVQENCKPNNSRNKGRDRRGKDNYKGEKPNDIGWHAKSKQLLTDSACIPWSYSTGRGLNRNHLASHTTMGASLFRVPGICALRTVIVPGVSSNQSDAINIAAQALYTDIRSQLKSANAYESSDVMIYMTAMAEIKAMIAFIRRILGTTLNYSFMNAYLPDKLIQAQGVSPTAIHNNFASYRSRANQIIAKASQIWWPKGFDYVTRAEWEYSNYYTEGSSIKDQIYMFTPGLFRKFTYDSSRDYAGKLEPCIKFTASTPHTMDEVLNALSDMIDAVVGDSDFQNIAGDLFNRYGAGGVETFSLIPDSYIVNPVFSYEVLQQIQNARCLYIVKELFDMFTPGQYFPYFDVSQDETNNILVVDNRVNSRVTTADGKRLVINDLYDPILTVDKDPSDEKTMLITRCLNSFTSAELTDDGDALVYDVRWEAAMELVVGIEFFGIDPASNTLEQYRFSSSVMSLTAYALGIVSNFHYHPLLSVSYSSGGKYAPSPYLIGSIDIYSVISPEQLKDMNRVDLMSLFAVPNVGKVNG